VIRLYGSLHSRAHRCAWLLKELRIDFDHVDVNFQDGSTRRPEFLSINPNGRVPVLETDEVRLFESLAINLYLARKHPGPLSPVSMEEDAEMTQWSFWVATEIEKPLLLAAANTMLFAPEKRSPEEARIAMAKLARPLGVLDGYLASASHLVGDRFTVADLNVSVVMTLARLAALDMSKWPYVDHWLTDCLERPAAADWKSVSFRIPRPETALGVLAMFV
jgi:glutathione S-transferase